MMRKFYLLLLLLMAGSGLVNAQWTTTGNAFFGTIRGTFFLNTDTGFVVGQYGTVAKTTDGGINWAVETPSPEVLRSIHFVDNDTGYTCGRFTILKSTDAGTTWVNILNNGAQLFRCIYFPVPSTGFAAGVAGTILRTTDYGNNWTTQSLGISNSDVIQVYMSNEVTGYAVCSDVNFKNGYVFKTTDGGETWQQQYSNADTGLLALAVVNADTIYAAGEAQTIIKSTDGGASWNTIYTGDNDAAIFRAAVARTGNSIVMTDDFGNVTTTYDAGASWTTELIGSGGLFSLHFPDSLTGFTGDLDGNVYTRDFNCVIPDAPGAITGNDSVCTGTQWTYSVSPVAGVDSYQWTVPQDATILSGQGDTMVTVEFGSLSGTVSVASASIPCGPGGSSSLAVQVTSAPQGNAVMGVDSVCTGEQQAYSTSPVSGVSVYTWSVPADATIVSGQGDTLIVVQFGNLSGEVSVSISGNECGDGDTTSLPVFVKLLPVTAAITGATPVCEGTEWIYTTTPAANGESYEWTVPADAGILSGQGDTSITVLFGSLSGEIAVAAINSCGVGDTMVLPITVITAPPAPAQIFGDTVFCSGDTAVFFINPVPGAIAYEWQVPNNSVIVFSQGDTMISVVVATGVGLVQVSAINECDTGMAATHGVDVNPVPSPTITFTNDTLYSSSPAGNQWYYNGNEIAGATDNFYVPTQNGEYFVIVTSAQACSAMSEPLMVVGVNVNFSWLDQEVKIYPNPASGETRILFPAAFNGFVIVTDLQGRELLRSETIAADFYLLNVAGLSAGFYSVKMISEKNELLGMKKLVVE